MTIKFSKLFLSTFFIFTLASIYVKSISPEEDKAQDEMMVNLFHEMGLDKVEIMTRENLRTILDKLLSKMHNQDLPQHTNFYAKIIEKYTSEVPEKFTRLDIIKYLNQDRVMKILQDVVKEHYGENYAEDLKPAFEEMGNAYKDGLEIANNSQNQADEGQSHNLSGEGAIDQTPNQDKDVDL
jgi:hypothetical protein